VKYLIEQGADVNYTTDTGFNAFLSAVNGRYYIKLSDNSGKIFGVETKNENYEYVAIMELLIEHGISINIVTNNGHNNALYNPAQFGDYEMINYLLQKGVTPNIRNDLGKTPYDLAIQPEKAIQSLLNSNNKDVPNFTPQDRGKAIAILKKATNFEKINSYTVNASSLNLKQSMTSATTQSDSQNNPDAADSLVDQATDCAKRYIALQACEKLPWPLSTGCTALTNAQFPSNLACNAAGKALR